MSAGTATAASTVLDSDEVPSLPLDQDFSAKLFLRSLSQCKSKLVTVGLTRACWVRHVSETHLKQLTKLGMKTFELLHSRYVCVNFLPSGPHNIQGLKLNPDADADADAAAGPKAHGAATR